MQQVMQCGCQFEGVYLMFNISNVEPFCQKHKATTDEKKLRKAKCEFCSKTVLSHKNLKSFKERSSLNYDLFDCGCVEREIL
jgi:hypothetical protein